MSEKSISSPSSGKGAGGKVAIIKYNAGNVQSVFFALARLGYEALITDDKNEIVKAGKVIFPGVGEASSAMSYLKERRLDETIKNLTQPVLGICLGMQLLCKHSEEGNTKCLGIFDTVVKRFSSSPPLVEGKPGGEVKIPQIGWNSIHGLKTDLFNSIKDDSYCYFVNSYYADLSDAAIAQTEYGTKFSSALQKDNFYGVQFHPEKSAEVGDQILRNFLNL